MYLRELVILYYLDELSGIIRFAGGEQCVKNSGKISYRTPEHGLKWVLFHHTELEIKLKQRQKTR